MANEWKVDFVDEDVEGVEILALRARFRGGVDDS